VVVGDKGVIMISDNQGQTWARQQIKHGVKYDDLYSVAFTADGSSGWVVGDNGIIYHSSDHGTTWIEQKAPAAVTGALIKVAVVDAQKVCAGGDHGTIVCTTDGGANWSLQNIGDIGLFDMTFTDADNGLGVGEFLAIVHTADGVRAGKSNRVATA